MLPSACMGTLSLRPGFASTSTMMPGRRLSRWAYLISAKVRRRGGRTACRTRIAVVPKTGAQSGYSPYLGREPAAALSTIGLFLKQEIRANVAHVEIPATQTPQHSVSIGVTSKLC
jgi:hypothetical protein